MKRTIATMLAILAISANAHAFAVGHGERKISLTAGEEGSVVITNQLTENAVYLIDVKPETLLPLNGAEDCSKLIRLSPKRFELEAGKTQAVKLMSKKPGICRVYIVEESATPSYQTDPGSGSYMRVRPGVSIQAEVKAGE